MTVYKKSRRMSVWLMLGVLCVFVCITGGCRAFELVMGSDGQPHTRIEQTLDTAGKAVGGVSGFVPIPGAGIIGGGLAAIMGLIGHSITSVVVSRRRQDALSTVIKGVVAGSENYAMLRDAVLKMVGGDTALQQKVAEVFEKTPPIKDVISNISSLVGNAEYLDKQMQAVASKMSMVNS